MLGTLLALTRENFLQQATTITSSLLFQDVQSDHFVLPLQITNKKKNRAWSVKFKLEECNGGTSCVRFLVNDKDGTSKRVYLAAVDTGSPYLVLSGSGLQSTKESSGSLKPISLSPSVYGATNEVYGMENGTLEWKDAQVLFRSQPRLSSTNTILGFMDDLDPLKSETGGTLLGLIKHPNPPRQERNYRPTWLEQVVLPDGSDVTSFSIDRESLVLSNQSLISKQKDRHISSAISLVDLRPLGEYVEHYVFQVKELCLDGKCITSRSFGGRPILAVIDTGLTGCLFSEPFWEILVDQIGVDPRRVKNMVIRPEGNTSAEFSSGRKKNNLYYAGIVTLDSWFYKDQEAPYVIVLGQTFLNQGKLTVEIEERQALFELYNIETMN
jgi:hypothetical protein